MEHKYRWAITHKISNLLQKKCANFCYAYRLLPAKNIEISFDEINLENSPDKSLV